MRLSEKMLVVRLKRIALGQINAVTSRSAVVQKRTNPALGSDRTQADGSNSTAGRGASIPGGYRRLVAPSTGAAIGLLIARGQALLPC